MSFYFKEHRFGFKKILFISGIFHIILILMVGILAKEPVKPLPVVIQFETDKFDDKLSSASSQKVVERKSNKEVTKNPRNKISKAPKVKKTKPAIKSSGNKIPSLVRNERNLGTRLKKQANKIIDTDPMSLKNSDYQVSFFLKNARNEVDESTDEIYDENEDVVGGGIEGLPHLRNREDDDDFAGFLKAEKTETGNKTSPVSPKQDDEGTGSHLGAFDWKGKSKRFLLGRGELVMPEDLKDKGIKAKVILSFKVDNAGRPFGIELQQSSGYTTLDNEVKRYTRTFRFDRVDRDQIYEAVFTQIFTP